MSCRIASADAIQLCRRETDGRNAWPATWRAARTAGLPWKTGRELRATRADRPDCLVTPDSGFRAHPFLQREVETNFADRTALPGNLSARRARCDSDAKSESGADRQTSRREPQRSRWQEL